MAPEVLTAVTHTPVLAGVCGTDPFMLRDRFLRELKDLGFAGIQNFPTVGLIDGQFRANLEETGMGYRLEVECVAAARASDLLTTPYAFTADEARRMTEAGADIVVAHMGLTTSGTIGAETAKTLGRLRPRRPRDRRGARGRAADVLVLCHGGPIAEPDDAAYVLARTRACDGFYGACSMERLPTEQAITEQTRAFKTRLTPRSPDAPPVLQRRHPRPPRGGLATRPRLRRDPPLASGDRARRADRGCSGPRSGRSAA